VATYGGGLLAGDSTALAVRVAPGATAVLATQASTKVYHARTADPTAPLRAAAAATTRAAVARGGLLALLPEPVVCFRDALYRQRQAVVLAPGASLVTLDWLASGRAARGEAWAFAGYDACTTLWLGGPDAPPTPLFIDAVRLAASPAAPLPPRMGPCHVTGTLLLVGPRVAGHAAALLADLAAFTPLCLARCRAGPPFFFAAGAALEVPSAWGPPGIVVRFAAEGMEEARAWVVAALAPLWGELGGRPYTL